MNLYKNLGNNLKEAEIEVTDEIKPVDHFIERGDILIPVRVGEKDEDVMKHLEKLGSRFAVEPTEEEKASGKYIQELVYSNPQQSGGLCWFEWVKNPDYVEPTEEVKESEVKLNADGVREDATDVLVDGYKKALQRSFSNAHTLQELSHILRTYSDEIDMRLYDEEDTNIQAMDVVKAFEKEPYKTMRNYQEALNNISAMEWDNKISKEAYEEYVARLQKAYNERKYR